MISVIWKHEIPLEDCFVLDLEPGAKFLSVQRQGGVSVAWFQRSGDLTIKTKPRAFMVVGTGFPFASSGYEYRGTWQDGGLVWHLFECVSE